MAPATPAGNHSDGSGSVSSDLSHFLLGSKAGTVIVDPAAGFLPLVIPGGFQLKASKGEDEPRKKKFLHPYSPLHTRCSVLQARTPSGRAAVRLSKN